MSTSASLAAEVPLETVRDQDESAPTMERMFDRYSVTIYRYIALRVGRDRSLADEMMQQLWLQACKCARAVPAEQFEFWLRAVAKNLINDHWRRKKRRPPEVPIENPAVARELADKLDRELLPPEAAHRREVLDQVMLAVTALPGEDQDLIIGHYVQGRRYQEIGEGCGISERAVEGRLYRARQKLKQMLAHLEEAV